MVTVTGIEAAAIHTMLCGDPEAVLDAIDDGALHPEYFADPCHRRTAQAILDLVLAGAVPWPETVATHLETTGVPFDEVKAAMLLGPEAFIAAGWRLDGLAHWLDLVAEDHQRRELTGRLLDLAHRLDHPGGPQRVARLLGSAAA